MTGPEYPFADRDELVEERFGHRIPDPYRWLEDRSDVRTIEWEAAQDYLAEPVLAALPGREALRTELTRLSRTGAVGAPLWAGERAFFTRRQPDQEHDVLLVREPAGNERVLIDPGAIDAEGTTTLDVWMPSWDGRRLGYQLSVGGDEESRLYVLDVISGEIIDGPIDRCRYSPIAWLPAARELFYVRRLDPDLLPAGEEQFHRRVYRHTVGTDAATDIELFGAGMEPTNYYHTFTSHDGRWLGVTASAGTAPRTDLWIADLTRAPFQLRDVQVGVDAKFDQTEFSRGALYAITDRDAPNNRLVRIDPEHPEFDAWTTVIPESGDAVLTGFAVLQDDVVLAVTETGATSGLSWWRDGSQTGTVAIPPGSVSSVSAKPEDAEDRRDAWVGYSDFCNPPSVLRVSLDAPGEAVADQAAPGAVEIDDVVVTETDYSSTDGTAVHAFILSPTGRADEPRPTILYGYGGFDISLTPSYSALQLAWVRAGGVFAIANLRGGSEHGEEWHRAGMRANKQNVFDDFAAAARHLLAEGWTREGQLGIFGGSNGGLLVGASLTQRPELFTAVVCSAPLLDMVRYEQFGLGRTWNDEYGTAEKADELSWLLGYSPYHNVHENTAYPAVLFTVFDSDTRVDPVHARKLTAALQHATTGDGPILLRRESNVGHGARSVTRRVNLAVDELAFLAARLGLVLE